MDTNTTATVGGTTVGATTTAAGNGPGQANTNSKQTQAKTYTAAELESEVDRRVQQALDTAQNKWNATLEERLKTEREEAAKMAKMTAEQRAEAERKQQQAKFEADKAQLMKDRMEYNAVKLLEEKSLPIKFAAMCVGEDEDATKANIETFAAEWAAALQKAVDERLKSTPPKTGGNAPATSADFMDIIHQNQRF